MCSRTRGPAMRPLLGDVADEKRRHALVLGHPDEPGGARPDLAHAARRAGESGSYRLDGVDHEHVGALSSTAASTAVMSTGQERCTREPPRRSRAHPTCGATPRRTRRAPAPVRRAVGDLEQEGGLADARSPPSSTSEPRTSPPPRTRSSSAIPVGTRVHLFHAPTASRTHPASSNDTSGPSLCRPGPLDLLQRRFRTHRTHRSGRFQRGALAPHT